MEDSGGQPALEVSLGARLQKARQEAGLTQQQLCQKAGLSYSTLAKIERGAIKSPSVFTIQQIAGVLGTSLDNLLGSANIPTGESKKFSKSGIGFVYFDINGCLVRFFHRAFTRLAEHTGARPDAIETAFWNYNDDVCTGKISMEEFNRSLAKDLGIDSLDWQAYYLEAITPISEMHELVRWAATQYKIGLISNIMPGFIDVMIKRGLVPDLPYTAIIDSSKVGSVKPDAKIYEVAAEKAGFPPGEILFIDDSRANLMPAQRLGWHVMWFDDYNPPESVKKVRKALEPAD